MVQQGDDRVGKQGALGERQPNHVAVEVEMASFSATPSQRGGTAELPRLGENSLVQLVEGEHRMPIHNDHFGIYAAGKGDEHSDPSGLRDEADADLPELADAVVVMDDGHGHRHSDHSELKAARGSTKLGKPNSKKDKEQADAARKQPQSERHHGAHPGHHSSHHSPHHDSPQKSPDHSPHHSPRANHDDTMQVKLEIDQGGAGGEKSASGAGPDAAKAARDERNAPAKQVVMSRVTHVVTKQAPRFLARITRTAHTAYQQFHKYMVSPHMTHYREEHKHDSIRDAKTRNSKRREVRKSIHRAHKEGRLHISREHRVRDRHQLYLDMLRDEHHEHRRHGKGTHKERLLKEHEDEEIDVDFGHHYNAFLTFLFPVLQVILYHTSYAREGFSTGPDGSTVCGTSATPACPSELQDWSLHTWEDQSCLTNPQRGCPAHKDRRHEVWRWIMYSLSHVDFYHCYMNVLFEILFGPSIEMAHGHARAALLMFVCVVGGGIAVAVFDPTQKVVGASGYVYGLIPIHISFVVLNWDELGHEKMFGLIPDNWFRLVFILSLFAFLFFGMLSDLNNPESRVSHAAHAGGAIFGGTFSLFFLRNTVPSHKIRTWLQRGGLAFAIGFTIVSIIWIYAHATPTPMFVTHRYACTADLEWAMQRNPGSTADQLCEGSKPP
ncbi:unnamed protein product [Amoebophrya sp. A25]|nr:unnamed protein product [Amoebophrya sp. A25]|eukprot:GSA25T00000449001.1